MKRIPLISLGEKVYFYADEFVCRCGKCKFSDPKIIPSTISLLTREHLMESRMSTGVPTIITRGVSCLEHHINIYKKLYGNNWEKYITWDSSHVPDTEKNMRGGTSDIFYGIDSKPLTQDYLNIYGHYCAYRFTGVIWYKRHYDDGTTRNSFIHSDNDPKRTTFYFKEKIYYKLQE